MKQSDLKSGITSNWLERAKGVSVATIGHEVWLEDGYWHEKMKDGTEVKYSKEEAYVKMYHDAKDDVRLPEYMRINGMWLNIHGCLLYTSPSPRDCS